MTCDFRTARQAQILENLPPAFFIFIETTMSNTNNTTTNNNSMLLRPDGSLNVDFLERNITNEIESHKKYRAEDDMKKRAIHSSKCPRFEYNITVTIPYLLMDDR